MAGAENAGKCREMPGNAGKCREMPGNAGRGVPRSIFVMRFFAFQAMPEVQHNLWNAAEFVNTFYAAGGRNDEVTSRRALRETEVKIVFRK